MSKAQYYFIKKFINLGQMEDEYWHIKLEVSRMIEMKNLCDY
ncbi:hypothetical protein Golax_010076 [Gossypium laxum]|uniref:Uncharacterized protein n=2 Tax=Gossypium TaxID=3633 RepID=A0A7J8ZG43_9ROSI|nr:hypothetical protein [Gossypium laxum]